MKKRIAIISAALALVLALSLALVACNGYNRPSIGAGESSAEVVSNGGYAVRQGKYLYYVNGFDGTDADNTFGTPVKQAILRSEIVEEGGKLTIDNSTTKMLAPKTVLYSSNVKDGGIAVFGDWVYYASPNYDKDKNGTASTTDVDFMRTKTDGTITQKIAKISGRDTRYLFTPSRIIYISGSSINYIDFTGMKQNKSLDNGAGAKSGTLVENTTGTVLWRMGCDRIFFVQSLTDAENSFKPYNELCSIKTDGTDKRVIASEKTFLNADEKPEESVLKVFKFSLVNMLEQEDGYTLYYTKSHNIGTEGSTSTSDVQDGFFCSKISKDKSEDELQAEFKANEYRMTLQTVSSAYPLGYEEGALLTISGSSSGVYRIDKGYDGTFESRQILGSSATVFFVDQANGKVYYTSGSELDCITYEGNAVALFKEGIKTDWLDLDMIGNNLFFFATDDDNYLHFADITAPSIVGQKDEDDEQIKTPYVGFEREEEDQDE